MNKIELEVASKLINAGYGHKIVKKVLSMKSTPVFYDVQQNTEEWLYLRGGKFTTSMMPSLLMGKTTKGYNDTIKKVAIERLAGEPTENEFFGNSYTERGHEFEPLAAQKYEEVTFTECTNGGFFVVDDWLGSSPDRCINDRKQGVEIKCPGYKQFLELLFGGDEQIVKDYGKQVQGQIHVCGFEWVDVVIYYPGYKILRCRIYPDKEMQERYEKEITIAIEAVKGMMKFLEKHREDYIENENN